MPPASWWAACSITTTLGGPACAPAQSSVSSRGPPQARTHARGLTRLGRPTGVHGQDRPWASCVVQFAPYVRRAGRASPTLRIVPCDKHGEEERQWSRCRGEPSSSGPRCCGRLPWGSRAIRRSPTRGTGTSPSSSETAPGTRSRRPYGFPPGSPALSYAVARGDLEAAFVNPSAMLTQAYRGTGLYTEPLPLRVIVSYPSWDRFVIMVQPRLGLTSLADIKEKRLPLRVSVRQDPHALDPCALGPAPADVRLQPERRRVVGRQPAAERRAQRRAPPCPGYGDGSVDIVFDEGIPSWLPLALEHGLKPPGAGRRHHGPHGGPGLAAGGAAQVALPTAGARRRVHRLQRMAAIHARVAAGRGRLPDLRRRGRPRRRDFPGTRGRTRASSSWAGIRRRHPWTFPCTPGPSSGSESRATACRGPRAPCAE